MVRIQKWDRVERFGLEVQLASRNNDASVPEANENLSPSTSDRANLPSKKTF
ncbi:hypothetical protein RESH_02789 [Rhodopirellula europaea SH398]|uniref:Uncharacterized protein n=1 Tax=Rhodopirellula europaea SH398 TaxID=1263868 RepID=M5SG47_9BACT|nr:hypothetical protein RESH_02789 [Rhodopirellula europaea SH398]